MAAKSEKLLFKDKQGFLSNSQNENKNQRYSNLNLNQHQNQNYFNVSSVQCCSNSLNVKKKLGNQMLQRHVVYAFTFVKKPNCKWKDCCIICKQDLKIDKNNVDKTNLQLQSKSFGFKSFTEFQSLAEAEAEVKKKKRKSLTTSNSSTLSLHIAAYENSIEQKSAAFQSPKLIQKKKHLSFHSASSFESPFEIPRQAKDVVTEPEIVHFKASQKMLNPYENDNGDKSFRLGHPEGTRCSAVCKSVSKILSILNSKYPPHEGNTVLTEVDNMAANMLEMNLLDVVKTGKIPQSYYDLELKGFDLIDDSGDSETESENEGKYESDEEYDLKVDKNCTALPYTLIQMKSILDLYDDKKFTGNRLKRVNKRFRFIKNAKQILRIRQQVRQGGTRNYKANELREQLFKEFLRWKKEKQVVRDRFLIDAALEIAERLKFFTFKASASWLLSFKRRYGIVGRKITQVVSVRNPHEEADIEKIANEFVQNVKMTIDAERVPPSKFFNADQMGLQLEMQSGRTLAFKGEKQVQAVIQSKNATTHSLTVQPLISADGKLILPVLVCLYEPSGAPKCFKSDLEEFKNLRCVSTKSGKVTSELMKDWMKDIFLPAAQRKSVLLLDSWTGFNKAKEIPEIIKKQINIITIPKKTTGKIQPLDVGHNRYTKAFYRTMTDKLRRIRPNFILSKRKNIGRLLNQTFEQLAAPRFKSLIEHAFIKAGYFDRKYEPYRTPDDYCFNFSKVGARCQEQNCENFAFIKCAWCEKYLCADDFLMKMHCCRGH